MSFIQCLVKISNTCRNPDIKSDLDQLTSYCTHFDAKALGQKKRDNFHYHHTCIFLIKKNQYNYRKQFLWADWISCGLIKFCTVSVQIDSWWWNLFPEPCCKITEADLQHCHHNLMNRAPWHNGHTDTTHQFHFLLCDLVVLFLTSI